MNRKIVFVAEFTAWLDAQSFQTKAKIAGELKTLQERGPALGRPQVGKINRSSVTNLKELRVQVGGSPFRLFFAFDANRQAVILCGGDKTGDKRFYDHMIPIAESLFKRHKKELEKSRKPQKGNSP